MCSISALHDTFTSGFQTQSEHTNLNTHTTLHTFALEYGKMTAFAASVSQISSPMDRNEVVPVPLVRESGLEPTVLSN
eukprot:3151525-Amphidinium_carterae.2